MITVLFVELVILNTSEDDFVQVVGIKREKIKGIEKFQEKLLQQNILLGEESIIGLIK